MQTGIEPFGRDAALLELKRIADWWLDHSLDLQHGGFAGEIDYLDRIVPNASKGIILNSRILWFFSELCLFQPDPRFRAAAERAFNYLVERFDDAEYGGAVWELEADGTILNGKKQTYALAFCIYAFSAYYRLSSEQSALDKSLEYFNLIETRARDQQHGGYVEAFARDWRVLDDVRLGVADMNSPKTMNTHLHILEAYTGLYRAAPSDQTAAALRYSVDIFCNYVVDGNSGHLNMFFDLEWKDLSTDFSYGHDIEASWLLWEAAEALADPKLLAQVRPLVISLADSCLREGMGKHGQVCNEYQKTSEHRSEAAVWWVQAEALVGFLNAWRVSGESHFRDACDTVWAYICRHQMDTARGEWHWLSSAGDGTRHTQYKAGFWKGPYHTGRAMMEACRLFDLPQHQHNQQASAPCS